MSKWLEDVVQQKVRQETAALSDESSRTQDKELHIPVVLSLLSGRKILEACEKMESCGKVTAESFINYKVIPFSVKLCYQFDFLPPQKQISYNPMDKFRGDNLSQVITIHPYYWHSWVVVQQQSS